MMSALSPASNLQALIFGLAVIGSATAAVMTKTISSGDYLTIIAGTGIVGGGITTAHVVGQQVNQAANGTSTPTAPAKTGGTTP